MVIESFLPELLQPEEAEFFKWLFLDQHFSNLIQVTENRIKRQPPKSRWNFICAGFAKFLGKVSKSSNY